MGAGKIIGGLFFLGILGTGAKVGYDIHKIKTSYWEKNVSAYWYGSPYKKKLIEFFCPIAAKEAKRLDNSGAEFIPGLGRKFLEGEIIQVNKKVRDVEHRLEEEDVTFKEAEKMIEDIYAPILGRAKTKRIMDIAKDPNYSPKEATEKIVDEVPTGLADPFDRFIKNCAKQYGRKVMKDYDY